MTEATGHDWFDWQPLVTRPPMAWPHGAKLAVAMVVSIEYYEMRLPEGVALPASLPGGFGRGPYPDFRSFSHREYGNRVGVFRVAERLAEHALRVTAALDAWTARERPEIVELCLRNGWEIAAHGEAVTRPLSSRLDEDEEMRRIDATLEAIHRATGKRPMGWHGPESGQSQRTPALLAAAGLRYLLDWPNDELPYAMRTPSGPIMSVPMAIDLDDVFAHWHRKLPMPRWVRAVGDALDRLLADGATRPRVLALNLHPWLIGQPWRISYLNELLTDLKRREGVWFATAGEIAERCAASGPP